MTEQSPQAFGGLLRQLRMRAQLTQRELAKMAALSTRTVSDLERGVNRTARGTTAELLADALDLASRSARYSSQRLVVGRRQRANALYCRGVLEQDAALLLTAADRYGDAGRPLSCAKALEAAADFFCAGKRNQAGAVIDRAVRIYTSLGATADVIRLRAADF